MPAVSAGWRPRVLAVVREIPRGRVASYGLVAVVAGRPGAARAIGNIMLDCDDPTVPCHRVLHADGSLAPSFRGQRARLLREGVRFAGRRVEMRAFVWTPRLPAAPASLRTPRRATRSVFGGSGASSRRTIRKDSAAL